jgi:hypothetical protein
MTTAHPDWLGQVKEVNVTPEHAEGRSETGAVLAAVADTMDQENEPFAAGEVMGVEIDKGPVGGLAFAMMVSTGCVNDDLQRIANAFAVTPKDISLMSPGVLLKQGPFTGLGHITPLR